MKGEFISFKTSDGLILPGFYKPGHKRSRKCVIFIHGLNWQFPADPLPEILGESFTKAGYNFLAFNNRGAGILAWVPTVKDKSKKIGGGIEKFEDCTKDIRAAINYVRKRGSDKIILVGHSTGCQKSIYYQSKIADRRVRGLVLLGPASDKDYEKKKLGKKFNKALSVAKKMIKTGKGSKLMPDWYTTLSARRYYNLFKSTSVEGNIFNYMTGKMKLLSKVRVPILAVYGSKDKYIVYTPEKELQIIKDNARDCTTAIVHGARHGFEKKEKETAKLMLKWMKKVI